MIFMIVLSKVILVKNEIKLIVCDMDGTLLDDNSNLPNNFLELLDKLNELGIIFVAASGRNVMSIEGKIKYMGNNYYLISDNGGSLKHKDEILLQKGFNKDQVKNILPIVRTLKETTITTSRLNETHIELYKNHQANEFYNYYSSFKLVDDVSVFDEKIIKMSLYSEENTSNNYKLDKIQALKSDYQVVRTGPKFINIMKPNTDKGNTLKYLLNHLNIDKDNIIAFGDFPNDIGMMKLAHRSYAMKDSDESVLKIADEVIGSNNDNSVVNKIVELLNLNI